jgi:hypothetical protein
MPEVELFLLFVRPLQLAGIRYIVTGSVASIFYGEPRLTLDVDLVVFLNDNQAALQDWIQRRGLQAEWKLVSG